MTSPLSAAYPAPSNWQDFERLCTDLYSEIYKRQFHRWGRSGQRQNGIDAAAIVDGAMVGLQCKGRTQGVGKVLTTQDVDSALAATAGLGQPLERLIILTTAPDDVALHAYAATLSVSRKAAGLCEVEVLGWNNLCDRIGRHPSIQKTYFGQWFQRPSYRRVATYSAIASLLVVACVVGGIQFLRWREAVEQKKVASVRDLSQFVKLTNDLYGVEANCEAFLSKPTFAFQADFRANCTTPASKGIEAIRMQIEKVTPELEPGAWSEVHQLSELMLEDLRQAEMAAFVTNSFEESVVRWQRQLCFKNRPQQFIDDSNREVERAGKDAMVGELRYYFVLRDFVIPGLVSMKARALVMARGIAGESIPKDLADEANGLGALLKARNEFHFTEPKQPFTLWAVKTMSAREITMSVPDQDPVEGARWEQLLLQARLKSLHGHPDDIEALISCGIMKPAARQLATSPEPVSTSSPG